MFPLKYPDLQKLFSNPHTPLSLPLRGTLLAAASSCPRAPATRGGQVLVDGTAVWNEAHAQLEVSGQATVCSERQDQERGEQQEAHHEQSHAAGVIQQVRAVHRCSMWLNLKNRTCRKTWVKAQRNTSSLATAAKYLSQTPERSLKPWQTVSDFWKNTVAVVYFPFGWPPFTPSCRRIHQYFESTI